MVLRWSQVGMSLVSYSHLQFSNAASLPFSAPILPASWDHLSIKLTKILSQALYGRIQLDMLNIAYIFTQAISIVVSKIGENSSCYFLCAAGTKRQTEKSDFICIENP